MYLIYPTVNDAKARNHEAYLAQTANPPASLHDTLYLWHMVTHPTSGEVALLIPDASVDSVDEEGNPIEGNVSQEEFAALVGALTADWTPSDEI